MEFKELAGFARAKQRLFSNEEYETLKESLETNPRAGDVIPQTGGLRKLRWRDEERATGKSGGLRIIYYIVQSDQLLMCLAYRKGEQTDLTDHQKKALRSMIASVKKEQREKARIAAQKQKRKRK